MYVHVQFFPKNTVCASNQNMRYAYFHRVRSFIRNQLSFSKKMDWRWLKRQNDCHYPRKR